VSVAGPPTARALEAATTTIPIVFVTGSAVATGIVPALARPEGRRQDPEKRTTGRASRGAARHVRGRRQRARGLAIPASLRLRADEVLE
jgi:hypothetical protein